MQSILIRVSKLFLQVQSGLIERTAGPKAMAGCTLVGAREAKVQREWVADDHWYTSACFRRSCVCGGRTKGAVMRRSAVIAFKVAVTLLAALCNPHPFSSQCLVGAHVPKSATYALFQL